MNAICIKAAAAVVAAALAVAHAPQQAEPAARQEPIGCELILDLGFYMGMASAFMTARKRDLAERNVETARSIARRTGVTSGAEFDAVGSLVRQKEWDSAYAQLQTIRRNYRRALAESSCT